jgi:predicted MFS family arabinose efflux permease
MLMNVAVQALWICYAPVASLAADAYGVKPEQIDLLANLFMMIYLPVAIPASWVIDRLGLKKAVGFGAVLIGGFGLLRALFPTDYRMALIGTVGISVGQPFLLNAFTKVAAVWFPPAHRATVTGMMFLAMFSGIGIGEGLTPWLCENYGFTGMQLIYGVGGSLFAWMFVSMAADRPSSPPDSSEDQVRALVLKGFRGMMRRKEVYLLSVVLFLGSGIVNAVFTLIDGLGHEKGLSTGQGVTLTLVLLGGGILGSLLLPALSDTLRRRKAILLVGVFAAVPSAFFLSMARGFGSELILFFLLGFFITGMTPVAYQYGAEITHPAPEGLSNGIFALVVQASGLLIVAMDAVKPWTHGSYVPSLLVLTLLLFLSGRLFLRAKESPEMLKPAF